MIIQDIKTEQLLHHPDNPRSEYQIEDLIQSIKEKGILQPLTVVQIAPRKYNVVAGNRRLEAAKAAGLTECPCIVQEMDQKDQAALMLIENMQRKSLTPYEQGKGVQLCLDLGMDEGEISKKTGFSRESIRHRKKLSELDQSMLKNKCQSGQISMMDLIKLEKIKDPEAKNRALDTIGTNNFDYTVREEVDKQERKEKMTAIRLILESFAEEMPADWYDSNYETVMWSVPENIEVPEDSGERQYCFKHENAGKSYESFRLYAEKIETEDEEDDDEEELNPEYKERMERRQKLEDLAERFYKMRIEFMQNRDDQFDDSIISWLSYLLIEDDFTTGTSTFPYLDCWNSTPNYELFLKVNLEEDQVEDKAEYVMTCINTERGKKYSTPDSAVTLVYTCLETHKITCCNMYNGYYHPEDWQYKRLYKFMEACGYKISDEERKILDGTHELYLKEDEDGED